LFCPCINISLTPFTFFFFKNTHPSAGGNAAFRYSLVSPVAGKTKLLFYVDSVTQGTFAAAVGNATVEFALTPGKHTLQWIYRRALGSAAGAGGEDADRALIHDIVLSGTTSGGASQCLPCAPGTFGEAELVAEPLNDLFNFFL
jgi:hypothetical protein